MPPATTWPIVALSPAGCPGMWDNITCWKPAHVGEMVLVSCPELFRIFNPDQGEFLLGGSSGLSQAILLPTLGPQAFLGDKHQRHGAPCRQIAPVPELPSWSRVKPQASRTWGHGGFLQTCLPGPRGDALSWGP